VTKDREISGICSALQTSKFSHIRPLYCTGRNSPHSNSPVFLAAQFNFVSSSQFVSFRFHVTRFKTLIPSIDNFLSPNMSSFLFLNQVILFLAKTSFTISCQASHAKASDLDNLEQLMPDFSLIPSLTTKPSISINYTPLFQKATTTTTQPRTRGQFTPSSPN
jgi:hypothetical protein